jgi:WD40 repeat protein
MSFVKLPGGYGYFANNKQPDMIDLVDLQYNKVINSYHYKGEEYRRYRCIRVFPDNKKFIISCPDDTICIYDIVSSVCEKTMKDCTFTVRIHPDGKHFFTANNGGCYIWDIDSEKVVDTVGLDENGRNEFRIIRIHPSGKYLLNSTWIVMVCLSL